MTEREVNTFGRWFFFISLVVLFVLLKWCDQLIYVTQFNWSHHEKPITVPSADSGFATLDDVEAVMGRAWVTKSTRLILYRGTAFSNYSFSGDGVTARLRIPISA